MAKDKKPAPAAEPHDAVTGEVVETVNSAVPALTADNRSIVVNGRTITLKKTVNRVLLRHSALSTVLVTVKGKIFTGKEIKGSKMAPADMVTVLDLNDGQEKDYIVSAVVKGLWEDEYPKDGYIGKSFAIYKDAKAEGKRYFNFSLAEIEVK